MVQVDQDHLLHQVIPTVEIKTQEWSNKNHLTGGPCGPGCPGGPLSPGNPLTPESPGRPLPPCGPFSPFMPGTPG